MVRYYVIWNSWNKDTPRMRSMHKEAIEGRRSVFALVKV